MKRDAFTLPLAFPGELIIDNFAGGGGTSEGLEQAFGRPVDIAINHDPEALAMHALNHPRTLHLCESVWTVDPVKVTRNQPVGLVWLSPDCKHFSKAKGGTPVAKEIRGLAWVGIRWVLLTKPRVLMLENVEEFKTWGPVMQMPDGAWQPDPAREGETFQAFCAMLSTGVQPDHPALAECCEFLEIDPAGELARQLVLGLGYAVDHRELRACDQGAPTIRKRLFMQARRDGLPIRWPAREYAEPGHPLVLAGKLRPYRTAAECIDFTLPAASIFDRKRELAENTQRRVAKGLWRHVLTSARPFIVGVGGRMGQSPARGVDQPAQTITAKADSCLATPVLAPFVADQSRPGSGKTSGADAPLRTQCAQVKGGHFTLVAPALAKMRGTSPGYMGGAEVDAPLGTVSAGGVHHGLVGAHLITVGYGERQGQAARAQEARAPLGTVVAANKHAVVAAFMEQANGGFYEGAGRPVDAPVSTITASGSNQRLVAAYCVKYYSSGGQWQGLEEPMHTLPTKGRMGLVQVVQVSADCLAPEHQARAHKCAALLHKFLPEHFKEPADLVLVAHAGQWWVLVDITLRMLRPRELFRAQGFPEHYIIDEIPDPALLFKDGVQAREDPLKIGRIPLTATAQVRMCGNSVSPYQSEALARTAFAHERALAPRVHAAGGSFFCPDEICRPEPTARSSCVDEAAAA